MGSNVGRRETRLREGVDRLSLKMEVVRVSRVYASEPWGKPDQRWFLNIAVLGKCALSPVRLLEFVKEVEAAAGRKARERWGPRELDVDILLMGDKVVRRPDLVIPHPRMSERRFCLLPASEIAPSAVVPPGRNTISDLLKSCRDPLEVYPL
ncbi:MAG: 2-amino-4-hydroxy-6-hydroxymethyldihydropteridine diphosphokinase [Deltaproteobacteria bacterium]|nr:2-amino-4-hydroxy-6-hydroxymethyldihydropteridine diphosphokinase [Deltaproteobacteria bacterium]